MYLNLNWHHSNHSNQQLIKFSFMFLRQSQPDITLQLHRPETAVQSLSTCSYHSQMSSYHHLQETTFYKHQVLSVQEWNSLSRQSWYPLRSSHCLAGPTLYTTTHHYTHTVYRRSEQALCLAITASFHSVTTDSSEEGPTVAGRSYFI